jgi:adenylyltransferase/sulfurtransferase
MLSVAEKRRYKRHIILPEVGEAGQDKLKSAKVLVVGAGGLGAPVLQYLTAAGVGTIAIMDDEIVNEDNLHRQILYGGHDLGKLKTIISKQRLNALNPFVNHQIHNIRLKPENAIGFVSQYDIVIDATDNISSGYLINDACIIAGKPWVYGALQQFDGQVSTFNYQNSPSLRCMSSVMRVNESSEHAEKGLFGVLPGIIGSLQAAEVIKIITGIGMPLLGKLLVYNMLTHLSKTILFEKNFDNFKIKNLQNSY